MLILPMEKTLFTVRYGLTLYIQSKLLFVFNIPALDQIMSPHDVLATSKAADQDSVMKFVTNLLLLCHVYQISNALYTPVPVAARSKA